MSESRQNIRPLQQIMITSRDFAEYLTMFALDEDRLVQGRVLDCAAGASDFAYRARALGARVVSADPLYDQEPERLRARVLAELRQGEERAHEAPHLYDFAWTGGLAGYLARRRAAATAFLADYTHSWDSADGRDRYVAGSLPRLPFEDRAFTLGLVPNLLFTYANLFDRAWHRESLRELTRVCDEVRVHPLTDTAARSYPELDRLVVELSEDGITCEVVPVDYRLRREPSQTLICRRDAGAAR
ncbi:hypothetical protein [Streptomyces sp. NPDC048720]|uniref:hypothetical protein n=1 Tax=Streptomyces sp. NPDC048720 TaxID=3365588 RepID=UPI003715A4E4